MRLDDGEIVERLLATPALLRLPLVRFGNEVAAGRDEAAWKRWFSPPCAAAPELEPAERHARDDTADADQCPARVADHEAAAAQQTGALADPDEAARNENDGEMARVCSSGSPDDAILAA